MARRRRTAACPENQARELNCSIDEDPLCERDPVELIGFVKAVDDSVGLRMTSFSFCVVDVFDREVKLIWMTLASTTALAVLASDNYLGGSATTILAG